jgi:hypothetical protein
VVCCSVDVVFSWSRLRDFFFFQVINVLNVWWEMTFFFFLVVVVVVREKQSTFLFSLCWTFVVFWRLKSHLSDRFADYFHIYLSFFLFSLFTHVPYPSLYFYSNRSYPQSYRLYCEITCSNDFSMECDLILFIFNFSLNKKKKRKENDDPT